MSLQVWLPLNGDLHNQGLNGLIATNNGATINNNGKIGKCYSFNGSSNYLELDPIFSNGNQILSFSCWMKISALPSSYYCLLSSRTSLYNTGINIYLKSDKTFYIDIGSRWITQVQDIEINKWYHIAVVSSNEGRILYINGIQKDISTTIHVAPTTVNTNSVLIGAQHTSTAGTADGTYFKGYMNDIRIYDHAISATEVAEIAKGLVLHYKLDDLSYGQTIYDCSGYSNDGTVIGNLTAAADSSRYQTAIVFNGSSAIKVNDNNWASQGMREMTINFWVKPTAAFSKFFSCTETGGWNTEAGNSGYLRFPIHVYTNAEQTTTAYKYDSQELQISAIPQNKWTMLTFIYDGSGTKTYINGELHHTYSNVSYGIHYNMNARLFLGCEAKNTAAGSPYYTGQQSDFRIYTTALTAEQILNLYNTSVSIDSSGNTYARELKEV